MAKPKRQVYQQCIVLPERSGCPFCRGALSTGSASLVLHIPGPPILRKIITTDLLYCERCQMHFVGSLQDEEFFAKHGGRVIRLQGAYMKDTQTAKECVFLSAAELKRYRGMEKTHEKKSSPLQTRSLIKRKIQAAPEVLIAGTKLELFEPNIFNWNNVISDIFLCVSDLSICPKCGARRVHPYNFPVLINNPHKCVKVEGTACYRCNIGFSAQSRVLSALEKQKSRESDFRLHKDYYIDPAIVQERLKQFERSTSSYCQVTLYAMNDTRIYTIERDRRKCDFDAVLHYANDIALSILTALYMEEPRVELEGKEYVIGSCIYAKSKDKFFLFPNDTVEVVTRKGGGYYSADIGTEQLDALVFCHNSRRLEVLPVSFDKKTGQYFVDSTILRGFYQKHGIPFVKYSQKIRNELVPMRDESYLHALGYNVGEQAGLNDDQRQRILADAADAGMPIQNIRRMLDFLINLNRNKDGLRTACEKWEVDKEFISNYKINQDNFVFAGKVRGIKQLG